MAAYVPNFGRPAGRPGPVGLWRYTDPNATLTVNLVVSPLRQQRYRPAPTSRDFHWMITWDVGMTSSGHIAQRRIHLVEEHGVTHLTNWGAITFAIDPNTSGPKVVIPLKTMTLAQRQMFEHIANNTNVRVPDGEWNCQDWCLDVLEQAKQHGLITAQEIQAAVDRARRVQPLPTA